MSKYYILCPTKTAGKALCNSFGLLNNHTALIDIQKPQGKNFFSIKNFKDILKFYYRNFFAKKTFFEIIDNKNSNFYIGTIRSPYARCISWFLDVAAHSFHQEYHNFSNTMTFYQFLKKNPNSWGLRPQTYWFTNWDNKIKIDYFIRQEKIEEDFNFFLERENLKKVNIKTFNQNPKKYDFTDYICQESLNWINEKHRRDFVELGYTLFDNVKEVDKKKLI